VKLIAILVVFLLIISPVLSYSGWLHNGENVSIEDETYTIVASGDDGSILMITSDNPDRSRIVLEFGESIIKDGWKYTYSDRENEDDSYREKYNLSEIHDSSPDVYKFSISIDEIEPKITVSKSISDKELAPLDLFNISVVLKNTGEIEILGTYNEPLPAYYKKNRGLLVIRNSGDPDKYQGGTTSSSFDWIGNLQEDDTVKLVQEIQLIGSTDSKKIDSNSGLLSYEYLDDQYSEKTDVLSPTYSFPLDIEIDFEKSEEEVGAEGEIQIMLNNEKDEVIKVNRMELEISDTVIIDKITFLEKEGYIYTWKGNIDSLSTKEFEIDYSVFKSGNITVKISATATFETFTDTISESETIVSNIDLPVISLNAPSRVQSNEKVEVGFTMNAEDTDSDFYDVEIDLRSPLFEAVIYRYTMLGSGADIGQNTDFMAPWVSSEQSFPINLTIVYRSVNHEPFVKTINKDITISKLSFDPHVLIDLQDYNISNKTVNLTFNISKIADAERIDISIVYGDETFYIYPRDDEDIYRVIIDSNKTLTKFTTRAKYTLNGSIYYFDKSFTMTAPSVVKSVKKALAPLGTPVPEKKGRLRGFRTIKGTVEPTTFIVALVVVLTLFFIIISVIVFRKKGVSESREPHYMQMTEVLGTDQLIDEEISKPDSGPFQPRDLSTAPEPSTDLHQLEQFVNKKVSEGASKDEIKKELNSKGWLNDIIEVYLK